MKNWFGLEAHPSDDLIHWRDVSVNAVTRRSPEMRLVNTIRDAYDRIQRAGLETDLKILLGRARHVAHQEGTDNSIDS